jgi:hypothetical protein
MVPKVAGYIANRTDRQDQQPIAAPPRPDHAGQVTGQGTESIGIQGMNRGRVTMNWLKT